MRYVLMICFDEASVDALSPDESAARRAAYTNLSDELRTRGVWRDGARLRPTSTATRVQLREGEVVVGDGPFAETKEQIAGFYVVDCAHLDEAIEIAAKIPAASHGTIEVRPIWEL
jgi:hypothetical protein